MVFMFDSFFLNSDALSPKAFKRIVTFARRIDVPTVAEESAPLLNRALRSRHCAAAFHGILHAHSISKSRFALILPKSGTVGRRICPEFGISNGSCCISRF